MIKEKQFKRLIEHSFVEDRYLKSLIVVFCVGFGTETLIDLE